MINIGQSLTTNNDNIDPTQYFPSNLLSSFVLSSIDPGDINLALLNLDSNKALLDVPNQFIKIVSQPLSKPLSYIFNESISTGVFPDSFKVSKVISLCVTDTGNYRPISILSTFTEVFERLVYNQLISFFEKNAILYQYQFGFRKGHSTEQAILELTDQLKTNIDDQKITFGIFLDLSKAFETVNHSLLLQKLYRYGIRGIPLVWLTNYLNNRIQYVEIGWS